MKVHKLTIFFAVFICTKSISDSDYENCIFVPFWQCKEDFSGLIPYEARTFDERPADYHPYAKLGEFDVCCKNECGRRKVAQYTKYKLWGDDSKASFGEFPWMLQLLHNGLYRCGASLIHPKVALTAAHCVSDGGSYQVRGGIWNRNPSLNQKNAHQIRYVKKRFVHPDFKEKKNIFTLNPAYLETVLVNDIALLILDNPFDMNEHVGLICLDNGVTVNNDYKKCIVTGWGKSADNGDGILKKIELPLVEKKLCAQLWMQATRKMFNVHPSSICGGGYNQDSCLGDGGSPLVCSISGEIDRYEQVGIVSWGLAPCGRTIAPGIYTNVPLFKNWIDYIMSQNDLATSPYSY